MKKVLKVGFIVFACLLFIFLIGASIVINNAIKSAGNVTFDKNLLISASSKIEIYNNENELVKNNSYNKVCEIENLPNYVKNAFISIEDKKFYTHNGINIKRIIKSFINNLKSGYIKEGGSTISQQLIKNTHLNNEKTFDRKIKEIILTKKLEQNFSKDDILETYLNVIYFGNNFYGIENASFGYFNKPSSELSLNEACVLAGLIKAPTKYSPVLNYENSFNRKNLVLKEMLKDGFISQQDYDENKVKEITLTLSTNTIKNIYEQAVIQEAEKLLNLSEQDLKMLGVKIYTYLDEDLQENVINIVNDNQYYHKNKYGNIADSCVVVIDNETGGINAFHGKCDYNLVNIKRQPGSTIKPILVYAPALEKGLNPDSQILDEKINIDGYSPNNVGNVYHGYVSVTEAIEQSLNIPAIKVMKDVGIENCKNFVKKVNLDLSNEGNNYALALGGFKYGTNLVELTNTFLPFSQKGNFIKASFIKEIKGAGDKIFYKQNLVKSKVMSEESAYLMNNMLIKGVENGTSKRLNSLPFKVAGKTGTVGIKNTNLNTDVYSVGYTKNKTCGVWLGNTTNKPEFNLEGSNNGGTYCTSMLKTTIEKAHKNIEIKEFDTAPKGIEKVNIDEVVLENEHKLTLAGENTPPVYKKTIEINKKFNNLKVSTSYSNPTPPEIEVKLVDKKPNIKFNAQKHLIYKIYRIEEDQTKILDTIKNKRGEIEFIDDTANEDTFYSYYVECYAYNYSSFTPSSKAKSNIVKFIIFE